MIRSERGYFRYSDRVEIGGKIQDLKNLCKSEVSLTLSISQLTSFSASRSIHLLTGSRDTFYVSLVGEVHPSGHCSL